MLKSPDLSGVRIGTVGIVLAVCAAPVVAPSMAATQLPIVCVAGSCGPNAPSFLGAGQATATAVGNTLTVQQTSEQAILNWASFNVSADGKVIFKQPNSSAIALNQIFQSSPSQIFGLVQANGQIYLINQNGFVFGPSAEVNTGGLLASTLPLTGALSGGLLGAIQNMMPALASDGRTSVLDASGNPVLGPNGQPLPVQIVVLPGAQISTNADGQRILLTGQSVINGGSISAPDGQVILAAGQSVFIQASTDPTLRGLIVEVDSGGLVENQVQGNISVSEGNITLVGSAVNQQGRLSATTSVSENGSIRLLARDTVTVQSVLGTETLFPSHAGELTLGPDSLTTVMPDTTSTATAIDEQVQPQSTITLAGQQVELMGGSQVTAPGGQVTVTASSNPSSPNSALTPDPDAHLRIDSGAEIVVAGSTASVPVTRNLVSVQLRGSELADSPLQRNGPLRGQTVIVDARVGTPLADVSGDLALIQRGVLERTSTGGSIILDSGGDVVVAKGATLNVSGGQVDYTPGIMQTSLLIEPDGATVDIGAASPNQVYVGVVNPTFQSISNQWGVIQFVPTPGIAHYDPGYTQGMSAGSIQILGSSMVLNGNFVGQAVNGIYQRTGSTMASGGTFTIGTSTSANPAAPDFRAPAVELVNQTPTVVVDPNASLPSDFPVELSTDLVSAGGFAHLVISSNDKITLPTGVALDLGPGGTVNFLAPQIEIGSSISIPAGAIQLTSTPSFSSPLGTPNLGIFVGNSVSLNVSGMWTNDLLVPLDVAPTGLALINAGSVQLDQDVFQGTLSLGSAVQLLANGGAQLPRGGTLTGGTGGSIALIGSPGGTVQVGQGDAVQGFGVQGALGGSLALEVPRLQISTGAQTWLSAQSVSSDPNSAAFFKVDSALFSDFGFSSFSLTADGPAYTSGLSQDVLTVMPGTSIDLRASTLQLDSSAAQQATGSSLTAFATPTLLPAYLRSASQLTLKAAPGSITQNEIGTLTVGTNASITADPGSSITLASVGNLNFDGMIDSPSGKVNLDILNPAASFDPGFVPALQIELGSTANINVAGTAVYQPQNTGLLVGQVLPGGSVSLNAARGSVITDMGSVIDFSGAQAPIDLLVPNSGTAAVQPQLIASAAGSLSVSAPESISLLGAYVGEAGSGSSGKAAGGTLNVTLSSLPLPQGSGFPAGPFIITVQPGPLSGALSPESGSAVISTSQLNSSGVDALNLVADSAVQFTNGAQLNLARSLTITAPAIEVASQATVNVSAPYIALGTASTAEANAPTLPGGGTISFNGAEIDLIGSLAFQGVANATLASSGEILLRGELTDTNNLGSLSIAGDMTLRAARVVPTTAVDFTITASGGQNNTVQFEQNGTLSGVPLSVAGSLTVNADTIIQGGTIFAPFGELTFNASENLTFSPGSLTSVSGTNTILPYGEVQNGTSWVYQVSPNQLGPAAVTALPNRLVTASGAKVTLASGATIDVSGGGDLDGYQWTPGTGGTTDVLSNTVTPGLYAVLPSLLGQTAPYDPMMWAGSNIAPNESVYLSGGAGLAAGVYPLLPARYSLLPGAYLVSVANGYQDLQPGAAAQSGNGFPIVSGYFTYGATGIGDTRTSGFLVEPGSYAQNLANYSNNYASTFFAAATANSTMPTVPSSPLPADGGTLVVSVQLGFDALGKVNGAAAAGGEGATVEINAPQIEVDPTVSSAAIVPGLIHLSSDILSGWNAGRLWLGLASEPNGSIVVNASSVEVTDGSKLTADEIILAATGSVQVDSGASLTTTSLADAAAMPAAATAASTLLPLSGNSADAAVLIASDLTFWLPDRSAPAAGPAATLIVAAGASVGSRGSLIFDAPAGGTLADGTLSGPGAQWSLGATNISFAPQGPIADGFALDGNLVDAMQSAGSVRLSSVAPIKLLQPVNLDGTSGTPAITEIDIVAPGINNATGSGTSSFSAGLITLTGGAGTAVAPLAGSGALTFAGHEIEIESGNIALSGFATTTLDASNAIVGIGNGSLATAGDLNMLSPIVTTMSGAQTQISAGGNLILAVSERPSVGVAPALQAGGSLTLSGNSVADSTLISMPSGEVTINAAQQLVVDAGAGIDTAGTLPGNAPHGSDGGTISLSSGGSLSVVSAVSMSVAAGPGADAGSISVFAGGVADIEAQLNGSAQADMRSGSFTLQAGSIPNFAGLNGALEQSGFHDLRSIEVGSGNLDLTAGSRITAQSVVLTADSGSISVAGTIDVSSASGGGSIALSAHNDLSLAATGILAANGIGGGIFGGQIELASTAGSVILDAASQVAAHGAGGSGTLLVRAPQASLGSGVDIASLPTNLTRVGTVLVEPMIAETLDSTPMAAQFSTIESNVASYMTLAEPAILNDLGLNSASNVVVRPYVDMTTQGNLTLPSIDFSSWRFNGQPADISIRSTGSLTVGGTVSDGFNTSSGSLDVMTSASARISLVAGANLGSASATAVVGGAAADLALNAGAVVRTGTGALELTAARDVVFGKGASIYTGGIQGVASTTNTDTGVPLSFPTDGGSITVNAGRDVIGAPITQAVDSWNPRFEPNVAAIWGIDFTAFDWNIGALGGGNVVINAGRNAIDVTAAVADSLTYAADGVTPIALGGGNLSVNTGGDVGSGLFYVGKGVGRIDAGGALTSTLSDVFNNPLGTLLLAGDASFYVSAQRDVFLQGLLSETALAPGPNSDQVYFFRYDSNSMLAVQSRGGSITYDSNPARDNDFLGLTGATQSDYGVFQSGPPSIDFAAFGSDVVLVSSIETLPSTNGQLTVYAARDITSTGALLGMSDQPLSTVATAIDPSQYSSISDIAALTYTGASLHQNDPNPVLISAGRDINDIEFDLPKQADISAGGNIVDLTLAGQNLNPTDVTYVRAGGSIEYDSADTTGHITLNGPGQLEVIAGANVDLGLSQGITTYGNILNPNLASSSGASITVLAGLGAPIGVGGRASSSDFLGRIIAPSSAYQAMLVDYVEQATDQSGLSFTTAANLFRNFGLAAQLPLIENVFFNELVVSGEEANEVPSLGFGRGYAAIDSVFPGSRTPASPDSGNLTLGYSRIYSLDGGSISILVPGGSINVGLANPPTNFSIYGVTRTPSDLGIVAVGPGDVDIYSLNSVLVNQSRVFTLGGGNITIWSTLGNIDAGNGAKTSISAPPPTVQVDANGNVTLDFGAAIAGSGIRTIQSEPDVSAGNVNLIAPVGFVNAGDAGIGSAGNINIAAQRVIGATNINFGGTATGVPPEVSGIGASLSGASSVANSATTASSSSAESGAANQAASAPLASAALGWLDVFVEGFGEEVCKANDLDCLKRNHRSP